MVGVSKTRWHGKRNHPLYRVWANMVSRCYNPKDKAFSFYGGRGIYVCDEWRHNPAEFIRWGEDHGWVKGLEIDRYPNNDGPYAPENVRFTTDKQNARNRRSTIMVVVYGQHMSLSEAVERFGKVSVRVVRERYQNGGWDILEALTTPVAVNGEKTHCPQGHSYSPNNTHVDSQNRRYCKLCRRDRERLRRRQKHAAG